MDPVFKVKWCKNVLTIEELNNIAISSRANSLLEKVITYCKSHVKVSWQEFVSSIFKYIEKTKQMKST